MCLGQARLFERREWITSRMAVTYQHSWNGLPPPNQRRWLACTAVLGLVMASKCANIWQHPSATSDWRRTLEGELTFHSTSFRPRSRRLLIQRLCSGHVRLSDPFLSASNDAPSNSHLTLPTLLT